MAASATVRGWNEEAAEILSLGPDGTLAFVAETAWCRCARREFATPEMGVMLGALTCRWLECGCSRVSYTDALVLARRAI